jgi:4-hydroxy-3-methylbut-2-enyl diphosphate reductase
VRDAIAEHGAPVYVRRAIVHNMAVVRGLEAEGAIFVEELSEVPRGSVVLFSAHGVAPGIAREAQKRGLLAYDAVCPLVAKVHREVERHQRNGRQLVLVGHRGHPEIEGTLGHATRGPAHLVASPEEVAALAVPSDAPTAYAIQTTYSVDDAAGIVAALKERFADLSGPASSDICYATTNRQAAVAVIAERADAVIVAGDSFSSNACRLAEVAATRCGSVQRVAVAAELDWSKLPDSGSIGLTAAASTPESVVEAIVEALRSRYRLSVEQVSAVEETTVFKRLAIG